MPTEPIFAASRSYWGALHLLSAANLARMSYGLEQKMTIGPRTEADTLEHRASVISAVFTSVAFLETTINELFSDAADPALQRIRDIASAGPLSPLKGVDSGGIGKLARMWRLGIPRKATYPVLRKFEVALAILEKEPFEKGTKPYQHADLLIRLRNEWIHYEPSWLKRSDKKATTQIQGLRGIFQLTPNAAISGALSLHDCASHGCAEWAVRSSIAFADEFFKRIGIQPNYEHFRSKLTTR